MTPADRELLALAAKAAGIQRSMWDYDWLLGLGHSITRDMLWNPLLDDGAVFRMAVDLSLFDGLEQRASAVAAAAGYDMCPREATRRAATQAAAAIGAKMP